MGFVLYTYTESGALKFYAEYEPCEQELLYVDIDSLQEAGVETYWEPIQ